MYISKISLRNIRGFKSLEFDLDRGGGKYAGWTVFTGSNGSGKSTLLKAIAYCLVPPDAKTALQPDTAFFRRETWNDQNCQIQLKFKPCPDDDELLQSGREQGGSIYDFEFANFPNDRGALMGGVFTHHASTHQSSQTAPAGWFSCGYGPFRRITNPSNANVEEIMRGEISERFATLFLEVATLAEVDPWLTKLRFQQLEGSIQASEHLSFFLEFVNDHFLPAGFWIDSVDSNGLWLRDINGVKLSWLNMSDGHRVALALTADIVRHMIRSFGLEGLYDRHDDGKIRILRSGVVLIDEIDAHLHPSWQREIGFWLKRHFPNVQFLVTSHSPIILQAADPNGLFVLPEPGSDEQPRPLTPEEYQSVIASRPDSILLSPAFGLQNTRSEPVVKKRAEYSRLQSKKRAGAKLSAAEEQELQGLLPFVSVDEEV